MLGRMQADGVPSWHPRDEEMRAAAGEHGRAPCAGKPHGGPGGAAPTVGTRGVPPLPPALRAAVRLSTGDGAPAAHLRAQHEVWARRRSTSTASAPSSTTCGACGAAGGELGAQWGSPEPAASPPTPRFVHSKNRAALSYSLALNHLADRTPQEMAALRGRRRSGDPNHGLPFPAEHYTGIILPESLDWRMYGKEGPGTAGSMESPHLLPRFPFTPHRLPRCPQARSPP